MTEPKGEPVNREAYNTTLHFIRESVTELTKKMDAFFRRVDDHEKQTGAVKTEVEVWKEKHSQLKEKYEKMDRDVYGPGGVIERLRLNENKLIKIFTISGAAIPLMGAAAVFIPMLWKN